VTVRRATTPSLIVALAVLIWPVVAGAQGAVMVEAGQRHLISPLAQTNSLEPAGSRVQVGSLAPTDAPAQAATFALRDRDADAFTMEIPALRVGDPAVSLLLADPTSQDVSPPTATDDRHWSSLPLLGEQARQRGYTLPLPFGISAVYNYVARDVEVTDVRVGINGAPLRSVSNVANFGARGTVDAVVMKADAWIFPFLDVYALMGYIKNVTDVNIEVTVPRPGPLPGTRQFLIKTRPELEGFVGGGGLTLAGGYRQFFAMVDANYSQTNLGFDENFRALIVSSRVGWNGKVGPVPLRLWVGGAFWDTANTAKSTVEVPGVGAVRFEADQQPKRPWNAVVGGSAGVVRHLDLFAEYGFNSGDVTYFAGGLTFRF